MPPPPGGPGPNVQPLPAPLPPAMFFMFAPVDRWGITFDLRTRLLEDQPPDGWGVRRATIYGRIARKLRRRGYQHAQYSVYNHPHVSGFGTFQDMCSLRTIDPPGVFPTCVGAVQMFHVDHQAMVATDMLQLGGQMVPHLIGPTPTNMVPNNVPSVLHPADPSWSW